MGIKITFILNIYWFTCILLEEPEISSLERCNLSQDIKTLIFSFFRSPPYNESNTDMDMGDIDLSFIDVRDILNLDENFQPLHQQPIDPNQIIQQAHQAPPGQF